MIYLLFSILTASALFIIFKAFPKYKIDTVSAIVVNYLTAGLFGLIFASPTRAEIQVWNADWFWCALIIGTVFISMFIVLAISSQKIGSGITAVSNKMSVVIPVCFAFVLYGDTVTIAKIVAIVLTLVGVFLATKIKEKLPTHLLYLPLLIFIVNGLLDTFIKFTEETYINESNNLIFVPTLFLVAFVLGLIYSVVTRKLKLTARNIGAGIFLGLVNYASIYFLVATLGLDSLENSVVFPLNNIGVVITTAILGVTIYEEKLSRLNWAGLAVACGGLTLLTLS